MATNGKEEKPGLELAYERIKDVLWQQAQTADHLDTKAAAFWAASTAVIGIGLSVAFTQSKPITLCQTVFSALAGFTYALNTTFFFLENFPSRMELLNHPAKLRQHFWLLDRNRFIEEISTHIENAHAENDRKLQRKAAWTIAVVATVPAEVVFVVLAILLSRFS